MQKFLFLRLILSGATFISFSIAQDFFPKSSSFKLCTTSLFSELCNPVEYWTTQECCKLCGGFAYPHRYTSGRCIYDPGFEFTNNESDISAAAFYTQKAYFNVEVCCEYCGLVIGDYKYVEKAKMCSQKSVAICLKPHMVWLTTRWNSIRNVWHALDSLAFCNQFDPRA